jgi:hypothetical protein
MSISWTRATSTGRPERAVVDDEDLAIGGHARDERGLHRGRPAPGDRDDRVVRSAAEDPAELAGERHHQLAERRVAMADVVMDQRALDVRGGVDRTGVEQRVARVALGLEQRGDLVVDRDHVRLAPRPLDPDRRDAAARDEREQAMLERRVRELPERLEDQRLTSA